MKKTVVGCIAAVCVLTIIAVCILMPPNDSVVNEVSTDQYADTGAVNSSSETSQHSQSESDSEFSWETFDGTEDEYLNEVASRMSELPVLTDYEWVYPKDGSRPYIDQLLVIAYYREYGEERAHQIVEDLGGTYRGGLFSLESDNDEIIIYAEYPQGADLEAIGEKYEAYPEVRSAGPNYESGGSLLAVTDDAYVNDQYYIFNDYFNRAWSTVKCDSMETIAVLDTGIDMDHPDLGKNIDRVSAFDAWHNTRIPVPLDPTVTDPGFEDYDHGTMVAGVACACTDNERGIAGCGYNAQVLPVRVADDQVNNDDGLKWEYLYNALEWLKALPTKPAVVNMSFAFFYYDDQYTSAIQQQINSLHDNFGIVFVAAVGNHGNATSVWPAAFENVIGVGALAELGDELWPDSAQSNVDICAPGENILTTYNLSFSPYSANTIYQNGYREKSGTSLSAPQVAAAAALVKRAHPEYSASDIESALQDTAKKLPGMGDSDQTAEYGHGALDAYAAVMWTNGQDPTTPPGGSPTTGVDDLSEEDIAQLIKVQKDVQSTRYKDAADRLSDAMERNPEIAAWLYVPGTNVTLPVARHEGDDEYYLVHGANSEDSPLGCAYMEEADSGSFDQPLTVLYGHSFLNTELMFTQLHRFTDPDFFEKHEFFYVITPETIYTYRILEAALYNSCNIAEDVYEWNETALQRFYDRFATDRPDVVLRNLRNTKLDASNDKLLMLSTCTMPADETTRFIVSGELYGERQL